MSSKVIPLIIIVAIVFVCSLIISSVIGAFAYFYTEEESSPASGNGGTDGNVNDFHVGDRVTYEWVLPSTATAFCNPGNQKMKAYGEVKKTDSDKVYVKWEAVDNPGMANQKGEDCCWRRRNVGVVLYFGDETTNPTYASGLKNIFTISEAKGVLKRQMTTSYPC